jgi:tetratricopeptide (TPR) repeat protein
MPNFEQFKQDLPLLVESGLIAIKQGDEENAKKLFTAVGIMDPADTTHKLGFGLIAMHKLDIKNAQKHFNELIEADEENWRAKAFLAFSHVVSTLQDGSPDEKIAALRKGADLATEVLQKCDVPSTRQLAQSVLDWEKEMQEKKPS